MTILTVYPRPVLVAVMPALLAFEAVVCVVAVTQGWSSQKIESYRWLYRNRGLVRQRRTELQREAQLTPAAFASLLTSQLAPSVLGRVPGITAANVLLGAYWRLARRAIAASQGTSRSDL